MKSKKWVIGILAGFIMILILIGTVVVVIDPFYHYHAPLAGVNYVGGSDVYVNDGKVKHFTYDTLVIGTSMTMNFQEAEVDEVFGVESLRVYFLGEGFKVINDALVTAVNVNPDLKFVIRSVDDTWFISDADWVGRESYPEYLYDDNPFNDVNYLFNKDVLIGQIIPTIQKTVVKDTGAQNAMEGFGDESLAGKEKVLGGYQRPEKKIKVVEAFETEEFFGYLEENLQKNVLQVIEEHPDITFYLFLPPCSILWWDQLNQRGVDVLKRRIDLEQYAIEKMLDHDNVRVFSFFNNFDLVCDLDNYVDVTHYLKTVNSQILQWMRCGEYELTKDNYRDYIMEITEFYTTYDYDSIFE